MAVAGLPKTYTTFIGREGAIIPKLRSNIPAENQDNPNLLSDEDLLRQISVAREIEAQRGLNPQEAQMLSGLLEAQKFRQGRQQDMASQEIDKIFGQGGGGPSGFDIEDYTKGLSESAQRQRDALASIFGSRRKSGIGNIEEIFGKQRGQTIDEQGALGSRLLSRSGQASIANVDAQKNKAIADFITSLEGEEGGALAN